MKRNKLKHNHSSTKAMDKPSVETAWVGVPKLSLSLESTDRKPILIDKHYYNREYKVKDNEIYTIRLGLHSHPNGLGAFTRDSTGVCILPLELSKAHVITGMFSHLEIYPAAYMDSVNLSAGEPFRLKLLHGSVALESNNGKERIPIGDEAISLGENHAVTIVYDKSKCKLPAYYTYTYDFITFQVKTAFEKACSFKGLRAARKNSNTWQGSIDVHAGERIYFRFDYQNNTDVDQNDVAFSFQCPPGLRLISSSACRCRARQWEEVKSANNFSKIVVGCCRPGEAIRAYAIAKVSDTVPLEEVRMWMCAEVDTGTEIFRDYSEIVVKS